MQRIAWGLLLTCAGCLAAPPPSGGEQTAEEGDVGDTHEALTHEAPVLPAAPTATRAWIHAHMPVWRLYDHATVVKKTAVLLAAGAVVPLLATRRTRASDTAITFSVLGTCIVDGSLADALGAGARASATGLCVGLGVYGLLRGRRARSA